MKLLSLEFNSRSLYLLSCFAGSLPAFNLFVINLGVS